MNNAFSGSVTGLFWLRKVLTPAEVSTLYRDTLVHRDSSNYVPGDTVISWSEILTTGSIHGGTFTFLPFGNNLE